MGDVTQNSRINVWINDAQAKGSVRAQEQLVSKLRNEWKLTKIGTEEYTNALAKLKAQNAILAQHTNQAKQVKSIWSEIAYQSKVFGTMAVGFLGVSTLFSKIGQGIQGAAKMSDVMADVQRTTGMTAENVEKLKSDLSDGINSRTATIDLLELAKAGGKLGVAQQDIEGFVKAADQINIALGEDLGADAITSIGKIVNIFKLKDDFGLEEAMLKVGSAINSAGQASEAQEGYIVDFLNRMGGVAPLMKMTAPEIIGLGATLDSLGQTSEVSSTALSKMFTKMADDAETYAKFANMTTEEFVKLLNEDAMEAFIRVLEGANKSSDGITALTSTLGDLGVEGGRAVGVFGTLANNTDRLRSQLDIANQSFEEGISITQEYTTKNETLGAALDKLMKRINGFVVNSGLTKLLTNLVLKMGETTTGAQKAAAAYETQKQKTTALEKSIIPLLDRYNALRTQTSLNAAEQNELEGLIRKISEILPTAVIEWDKYGNAIDISSDKVREAIKQNKELTQALGEKEIKKLTSDIKSLGSEAKKIQEQLNKGGFDRTTNARGGSYTEFIPYNDAEMTAKRNELIRANKTMYDNLKRLSDEYQIVLTSDQQKFITTFEQKFGAVSAITEKTKEELAAEALAAELAAEKAKEREAEDKKRQEQYKKDAEALKKFIQDKDHELLLSKMDANEAELDQIRYKYDEQLKMAKGHATELKQIEELRDKEIAAAVQRQKTEWMNLRADVQEEIFVAMADEYTLSMKKIDDFYEQLIIKAEQYKIDTTELFKAWTASTEEFNQQAYAAFGQGLAAGLQKAFGTASKETEENTDRTEKLGDSLEDTALAWVKMGMAAAESADEEHSAMELMFNSIRQHIKALAAQAIAKAIVGAIGTGPLGIFVAGLAGVAAGALFDNLVPEFVVGGPTDGANLYIAGEAGEEWIAPNKQLRNPETRPYIDALETHRTTGRFPDWFSSMGYAPNYKAMSSGLSNAFSMNSGYGQSTVTHTTNNYGGATSTGRIEDLLEVLIDTTEKNKDIVFQDKSITGFKRRDDVIVGKASRIQ